MTKNEEYMKQNHEKQMRKHEQHWETMEETMEQTWTIQQNTAVCFLKGEE